MEKITFIDKVDSVVKPIPDINKIVAENLNSLKRVANQNVDEITAVGEKSSSNEDRIVLIEKSNIHFTLKNTSIESGTFTTDSLNFDSLTYFRFNNIDSFNRNMISYFELIFDSKDDIFLKIKNNDSDDLSYLKVSNVIFNEDDTTTIFLSKFNSLSLGQLDLESQYQFELAMERSPDFSDSQLNRLKDSVYENLIQTLSVSPTSFEKGVQTNLIFTWNTNKRDDTLNSVLLDGIDKIDEATGVNRTYTLSNQINSRTVSLITGVTRNDVSGGVFSDTKTATSTERIPQYYGLIADGDSPILTYLGLQNYTKFISSSSAKSITETYVNQRLLILSINSNAIILDGNGFNVTSAFVKSTVTMKLANEVDQSITQYLLTNPLNSTGTYTIN